VWCFGSFAAKHLIEFTVAASSIRLPSQATRQSAVHAAKEALDHVGQNARRVQRVPEPLVKSNHTTLRVSNKKQQNNKKVQQSGTSQVADVSLFFEKSMWAYRL
jgi:hypothetical protein